MNATVGITVLKGPSVSSVNPGQQGQNVSVLGLGNVAST